MKVLSGACFLIAVAAASAALAQVDIRSPWANVYVGPGGVYVHGPWGRVDCLCGPRASSRSVAGEYSQPLQGPRLQDHIQRRELHHQECRLRR